jgi:hypothetical protein
MKKMTMRRTVMENSTSETDVNVEEVPELSVELEVDQENLVKLLRALTEAGVDFRLKKVAEKSSVSAPPVFVPSVFTPPFDPNIRFHWHTPAPVGVVPPGGVVPPSITISQADIGKPMTSSTVIGIPKDAQISYTSWNDPHAVRVEPLS